MANLCGKALSTCEQTVLHLAARSGNLCAVNVAIAKVKGLKAKEGGIGSKDRWGRTAVQWAAANGHEDAVIALVKAGARTDGIPDGFIQKIEMGKQSQPLAVRKTLQPSERIKALVDSLPQPGCECTEAQRFAITALRDFCCGERRHRELALGVGAASKLVEILAEDPETQPVAAASQTLRNLSAERVGAAAIREAGAIPALGKVIARGPSCEAAWRAAAAIAQMCDHRENWQYIRGTEAASALRRLALQTRKLHLPDGLLEDISDNADADEA